MQTSQKKELRFSLIEKALYQVIEPLENIIQESNLGLNAKDLSDFAKLQQKTKSLYEYLNFFADTSIRIYKDYCDKEFWQVYNLELTKNNLDQFPRYEQNHIDNAIQNAFYFYFGLYAILPKIYFKHFKKELDKKTFLTLVKNSRQTSKHMSMIHFDMFRSFIYSSSQTKVGVATRLHNFFPDTFLINEQLEIQLSPIALSRAKAHTQKLLEENKAQINKESPTLGCPAKFVKINAETDLIDLIHQWVYLLMQKYILTSDA